MADNPVANSDPDGRWVWVAAAAVVGGIINVATHWDKIHGFGDGAAAFGIGAAAGLLAGMTGNLAAGAAITAWGSGTGAVIAAGAVAGGAGAGYGSLAQGIGNMAYFGDHYSLQDMGRDIAYGAIAGAAFSAIGVGINAARQRFAKPNNPILGEPPLSSETTPIPPTNGGSVETGGIPEYGANGNIYDGDGFPVDLKTGGYSTFAKFKADYGNAGQGNAWHHIVEQRAENVASFGAEAINHPDNLVKISDVSGSLHRKVCGYYQSKQPSFTGNLTVRQWLSGQSYNAQYKFGIQVLKMYGWNPAAVTW